MPKYRINYFYDGKGSAIVEASTPEEAEELFHEGNFIDDQDNSENYCIDSITKE